MLDPGSWNYSQLWALLCRCWSSARTEDTCNHWAPPLQPCNLFLMFWLVDASLFSSYASPPLISCSVSQTPTLKKNSLCLFVIEGPRLLEFLSVCILQILPLSWRVHVLVQCVTCVMASVSSQLIDSSSSLKKQDCFLIGSTFLWLLAFLIHRANTFESQLNFTFRTTYPFTSYELS